MKINQPRFNGPILILMGETVYLETGLRRRLDLEGRSQFVVI